MKSKIQYQFNVMINPIIISLFLLCGLGTALLCSRLMDLRQYQIVSQLAGQADTLHPAFSQALILSLKNADAQAASAGGELLDLYGYHPEVFSRQNFAYFAPIFLAIAIALALFFLAYRRQEKYRRKNRLEELIRYLETARRGGDGLLSRREDEFSLLEDQLFKTVTELKAAREQALAERRSLAANLADIAHQLKTPITSMSLMAQLLTANCKNAADAAGPAANSPAEADSGTSNPGSAGRSSCPGSAGAPPRVGTHSTRTDCGPAGDERSDSKRSDLEPSNCSLAGGPGTEPGALIYENINYVNKITTQLTRLEGLVTSLLTLSRLDAGTLILEKSALDASAVLTLAAESLEPVFAGRSQTFSLITESESIFTGDRSWTTEALINILKNCSEHTPAGGSVSAVCSGNPLYAQIVIQDSGSGFDQEDLPRLFQRFYRGKKAADGSVGIGLALSRSIIEQQNGTIKAENRPEGGARFLIKFYR